MLKSKHGMTQKGEEYRLNEFTIESYKICCKSFNKNEINKRLEIKGRKIKEGVSSYGR